MSLHNHQQHQFHSALLQIQQWVQTLISLASDVRFIAISNANSVILCSDILRVIDEVVVSSRSSINNNNNSKSKNIFSDLEQKVEDQAKISMIERTFSLISKWISTSNNNSNCKNGLNVQLHFALSLLLMKNVGCDDKNLSSSSFSRMKIILKQSFQRTREEIQKFDMLLSAQISSSKNLRLLLAKLCHHYHDGELTREVENQIGSLSSSSPSQAFLLSISNHASFLVVEALAQQIEKSINISVENEDSSLSVFDQVIRRSKINSHFLKKYSPKIMSIPYPSNPSVEPNVLEGFFVSYLFTPNQILGTEKNRKKKDFWETNQDSSSVAWRMNESFDSDCGVVVFGKPLNDSISYFDSSHRMKKSNNQQNPQEIFLTLISEVEFSSSFNNNHEEEMILQFANCLWNSITKSKNENENNNYAFIFILSSTTTCHHANLEFLANVAKKIEKRIEIFSGISSVAICRIASYKSFENIALTLDFIPESIMISSELTSSSSNIEFITLSSEKCSLRFYYSGILPDSLIISRGHECGGKGILMQLTSTIDDDDDDKKCGTTLILHRRTISQLSALQSLIRRIWDHLISCLQPSAKLVRGGGFLDCMWLKNLVKHENHEDEEEDDESLRRHLENAIRSYLCALVKSDEDKVNVEERINNFIANNGNFTGLFSGNDNDNDDDGTSMFPVDVLQIREENLLKALDFAEFVSSITAVERSWNVDFRQKQQSDGMMVEVVVNRALEFH